MRICGNEKIKYFNILIFVLVGWECNCYGTTIEIFAQQTSKQSPCQIITENYINFQTTPPLTFCSRYTTKCTRYFTFFHKIKIKIITFLKCHKPSIYAGLRRFLMLIFDFFLLYKKLKGVFMVVFLSDFSYIWCRQ